MPAITPATASSSGDTVELTLTCNGTEQGNDTRAARRFARSCICRAQRRPPHQVTVYNNDQLAGGDMTKRHRAAHQRRHVDIDVHSTTIISSLAPSEAMVCDPALALRRLSGG